MDYSEQDKVALLKGAQEFGMCPDFDTIDELHFWGDEWGTITIMGDKDRCPYERDMTDSEVSRILTGVSEIDDIELGETYTYKQLCDVARLHDADIKEVESRSVFGQSFLILEYSTEEYQSFVLTGWNEVSGGFYTCIYT